MALAKKFARFAKDAVINTGDFWFTGMKAEGLAQIGFGDQIGNEVDSYKARVAARKAARNKL